MIRDLAGGTRDLPVGRNVDYPRRDRVSGRVMVRVDTTIQDIQKPHHAQLIIEDNVVLISDRISAVDTHTHKHTHTHAN